MPPTRDGRCGTPRAHARCCGHIRGHRRRTTAGVRTRTCCRAPAARPLLPLPAWYFHYCTCHLYTSRELAESGHRLAPPAAHRCHRHRRSPSLATACRHSPPLAARTPEPISDLCARCAPYIYRCLRRRLCRRLLHTRAAPFSARRPPCRPLLPPGAFRPPEVSSWMSPSLPPAVSPPASPRPSPLLRCWPPRACEGTGRAWSHLMKKCSEACAGVRRAQYTRAGAQAAAIRHVLRMHLPHSGRASTAGL
jgi:hypothetical protein